MQPNTLDIGSKSGLSKDLSNITARPFTFDDVECSSIESFLQALKFDKVHLQQEVCKLSGLRAKERGKERNNQWKIRRGVWWNDVFYARNTDSYYRLLDRMFIAVANQDESFKSDLQASGDLILTNNSGKNSTSDTVLTQSEFCSRLMKLRTLIRKNIDLSTLKKL